MHNRFHTPKMQKLAETNKLLFIGFIKRSCNKAYECYLLESSRLFEGGCYVDKTRAAISKLEEKLGQLRHQLQNSLDVKTIARDFEKLQAGEYKFIQNQLLEKDKILAELALINYSEQLAIFSDALEILSFYKSEMSEQALSQYFQVVSSSAALRKSLMEDALKEQKELQTSVAYLEDEARLCEGLMQTIQKMIASHYHLQQEEEKREGKKTPAAVQAMYAKASVQVKKQLFFNTEAKESLFSVDEKLTLKGRVNHAA